MQTMRSEMGNCGIQSQLCGEFGKKLSEAAWKDLEPMLLPSSYPSNVILFSERDPARGVYVVLEGEVKLSINSSDGRRLSLRIVRKGEMVGLASTLSGKPYEMTADTLYPAKLAFIGRREFTNFLMRHPEAYQPLSEELSREYSVACEQLRTVGLAATAPEKLARLLLDWSENGQKTEHGTRFRFSLTHGEIGEFIGASRETVTRTLTTFKNQRLVACNGSTVTIPNRMALENFAHC